MKHRNLLFARIFVIIFLGISNLPALSRTGCFKQDKVKLLVVIDATDQLVVDYRTTGNTVRQVLMVGGLLDPAVSGIRKSSQSNKLRETVGDFNRYPVLKAAVEGALGLQRDYIEVTVSDDLDLLRNSGKPDMDKIKPQGFQYVLALDEKFAGQISAWKLGTLSASSSINYELTDVNAGNRLAKGVISGFAKATYEFDQAVSDKDAFVKDYPLAVGSAIGTIYGQLNKEGYFTLMAQTAGFDVAPPIIEVLQEYEKKFHYSIKTPKGWNTVDMGTKYTTVLAPKNKDREKFGLRFDVDLLLEEFGQDVDDLEAYVALFRNKVLNLGYKVDNDTKSELTLPDGSLELILIRADNIGKEQVIFSLYGEDFVGIFSVVILEDYEGYVKKYQDEIENSFASIDFRLK